MKMSEAYPELFHYTTLDGLYGIINNKCLWATHYKFVNDQSELNLARDKIVEFLYPSMREYFDELLKTHSLPKSILENHGGIEGITRHEINNFINSNYHALGNEIYITSFCTPSDDYTKANGLLSQWRAYGPDGGVSVVFDTLKLEDSLGREGKKYDITGHIGDVVYSDDEEKFKEEFSEALEKMLTYFKNMVSALMNKKETPLANDAIPAFMQITSRYKHRSFKEEREARIVSYPIVHSPSYILSARKLGETIVRPEKPRKFRNRAGIQAPYIELGFSSALPIRRVIVGPHRDKLLRHSSLETLFSSTAIEVTVSEIPYVG